MKRKVKVKKKKRKAKKKKMLSALFNGSDSGRNGEQNPPAFPSRSGTARGRGFSRERGRGRGRGRKNWNSKGGNNFNTDKTGFFANKTVSYAEDKGKTALSFNFYMHLFMLLFYDF